MKARLQMSPFGDAVVGVDGGRSILLMVSLGNGSMYEFEFALTRPHDDGTWGTRLYNIREVMPPITPQASGYGPDTRLRMPAFADEVAQRRKEWAEIHEKEVAV